MDVSSETFGQTFSDNILEKTSKDDLLKFGGAKI